MARVRVLLDFFADRFFSVRTIHFYETLTKINIRSKYDADCRVENSESSWSLCEVRFFKFERL